jgi:hypothetical protein
MLEHDQLPEALRKDSILRIMSKKVQWNEAAEMLAEQLFNAMSLQIDLRCGVVMAVFPELSFQDANVLKKESMPGVLYLEDMNTVAQLLVRRVASLVSPFKTLQAWQFDAAVQSIYNLPMMNQKDSVAFAFASEVRSSPKRFTAGGVMFEPMGQNGSNDYKNPSSSQLHQWRLSRQLYHPVLVRSKELEDPKPSEVNSITGNETTMIFQPSSSNPTKSQEPFRLYDGRFWIRVHHSFKHGLELRPLKISDLNDLRKAFKEKRFTLVGRGNHQFPLNSSRYKTLNGAWSLEKVLADVAKDKIRFTLPVIAIRQKQPSEGQCKRTGSPHTVLAFPTLGLTVVRLGYSDWSDRGGELQWEVRYKKIDIGKRRLKDCMVG